MNELTIKSPGVYINEINAFPNSVVPAPTAVPAFYWVHAASIIRRKSYTNVAMKISTFAEFKAIYCYPDPPAPASPTKQYNPEYYLVKQKGQP
ncbi:MAG: hypothetical protein R2793_00510 [Flavobacteriaceae bacterium]